MLGPFAYKNGCAIVIYGAARKKGGIICRGAFVYRFVESAFAR
jgi:hypothetical protein